MKFNVQNVKRGFKKGVRSISKFVLEYGSPNPKRFDVIRSLVVNGYLIVRVNYPNCNNYEGNKILVFPKDVTMNDLWDQEVIDPRFSDDEEFHHPVARFIPTARGWNMAVRMIHAFEGETEN